MTLLLALAGVAVLMAVWIICGAVSKILKRKIIQTSVKRFLMRINEMEFSKVCFETRLRLNLSQEKLAKKLNVYFTTINRWENGKTIPQKLILYRFIKFCAQNGIEIRSSIENLKQ